VKLAKVCSSFVWILSDGPAALQAPALEILLFAIFFIVQDCLSHQPLFVLYEVGQISL